MNAGERRKKQQIKEKPLTLEKSQVCVWGGGGGKAMKKRFQVGKSDSNATDRSNKMRTKKWSLDLSRERSYENGPFIDLLG